MYFRSWLNGNGEPPRVGKKTARPLYLPPVYLHKYVILLTTDQIPSCLTWNKLFHSCTNTGWRCKPWTKFITYRAQVEPLYLFFFFFWAERTFLPLWNKDGSLLHKDLTLLTTDQIPSCLTSKKLFHSYEFFLTHNVRNTGCRWKMLYSGIKATRHRVHQSKSTLLSFLL